MHDVLRSFFVYLSIWLTELRHDVNSVARYKVKLAFGAAFSLFFLLFVFAGFYRIISYVKDTPIIGSALVARIISMVFLSLFLLLIYSSVITAFSTVFFSKDNKFLLLSPFNWKGVLLVKQLKTVFYSSWMSMLIIIPLMSAVYFFYRYNFYANFIIAVSLILFFIITASAGLIAVLFIVRTFPARKVKDLLLIGIVVIGTSMYLLFRFLNLEQILRPGAEIELVASYISSLEMPSREYLPSHWISRVIIELINGRGRWLMSFIKLFLTAAAMSAAYVITATKTFYSSWEKVQSEDKKRYFSLKFPKNPVIAKDLKSFFRDTRQWTQLILIAALVVIYIINIYKLPLDLPYLHYIIAFANIGMIGAVISSVGLRFAFSCYSMEGTYFWIILCSPFSRKKLFMQKYLENFLPIFALSMILVTVSNIILKPVFELNLMSLITVFVFSVTITSMGIYMGITYPKFSAGSPAEIESSWGAVLYMIYSFFYIAVSLALEAVIVRMYFIRDIRGFPVYRPAVISVISILIVLNIVINYFTVSLGNRRLESIEFSD